MHRENTANSDATAQKDSDRGDKEWGPRAEQDGDAHIPLFRKEGAIGRELSDVTL